MKVKHLIAWIIYFSLLASMLMLVGCASIPSKDWECRHWVVSRGERYFQLGRKVDIVRGMSRGDHIVDEIYLWEPHIRMEGEHQLDTADSRFVEKSRWRLNQGYPEDEQKFMEYVNKVKEEGYGTYLY